MRLLQRRLVDLHLPMWTCTCQCGPANVALHLRSADRQGAAADNLNLFTGFRCVMPAAKPRTKGPVEVQQAGDRFVNFVLEEIKTAQTRMKTITHAANLAADAPFR